VADTQRLYAAAREPKELWLIPDAAHVDYLRTSGAEYQRRVLAFFDRALRTRQRANPPPQPRSGAGTTS